MAPFNKRQIGYIQAIAGRQQHVTLRCGNDDGQISSIDTQTLILAHAFDQNRVVIGNSAGTQLGSSNPEPDAKSLLLHTWHLDYPQKAFGSSSFHNDDKLTATDFTSLSTDTQGMGNQKELNVFAAEVKGSHAIVDPPQGGNTDRYPDAPTAEGDLLRNPEKIPSVYRATPDGFLNSTDIKFRFTLPANVSYSQVDAGHENNTAIPSHAMGQDHYEFRWIVWRHKKPGVSAVADTTEGFSNAEMIRDGASFRNPAYDLFMGQTGRKRGLLGYTQSPTLDKDKMNVDVERYSGYRYHNGSITVSDSAELQAVRPDFEKPYTVDDLLNVRLNRDDYVIMKDVRFFLGKEHGKSHFEDHLHWDWNDPIDTTADNVLSSPTLNDKNYRWRMTLIGTSNGKSPVVMNHSIRWTTKMESG